jgi:hypothetical protein
MIDKPFSIFLSCGTPDTPAQEAFLAAVEEYLRIHGCEPKTVGRSVFSGRQPVQAARDCIGTCDGAIVIAFERTRIIDGLDRPESAEPTKVQNESHPTVWNQMEAAMAYAQRVPILTLVQPGLKRHGMLSTRLEWVALEKEQTPSLLATAEFRQVFAEWLAVVRQGRVAPKPPEVDPAALKIGYLMSQLSFRQLAALVVAMIALLSSVATISFQVGQWRAGEVQAPAPR